MMKISVIIPAFNAQQTIEELLKSLLKQNFPQKDYEVILVNDGSTDKTEAIAKKYPLVYLKQKNKGAGSARNLGAKKAKGEIIIFIDSDCLVEKNWLKKHYNSQKNRQNIIIGGGVKKPREKNYLAWVDYFTSWYNAHQDLKKHQPEYLPSLNLSIKKKDFEKVKFWNKKSTGEDVDFCFRARKEGLKIFFDPKLAVWHKGPSLKGFFKHQFNWGSHTPLVRGSKKKLAYNLLFTGGLIKALFFFLPIVIGKTVYQAYHWLAYQPLRFLLCLPLIFLGNLAYGWGFLKAKILSRLRYIGNTSKVK